MIPKFEFSVLTSNGYANGALRSLQVFVQASIADFPSMRVFSGYAPMHGSYVGLSDEEFLETEIGAALKDQASQQLREKWTQLLTATKEGAA